MAAFRFPRTVAMIPELRELIVEILYRGFLLLQKIGDKGLLAILHRLFVGEELLDISATAFFRHG